MSEEDISPPIFNILQRNLYEHGEFSHECIPRTVKALEQFVEKAFNAGREHGIDKETLKTTHKSFRILKYENYHEWLKKKKS